MKVEEIFENNFVIYNLALGLYFSGFNSGKFTKYYYRAKCYCDYHYACDFLRYYNNINPNLFTGFRVFRLIDTVKVGGVRA